MWARCNLNAQKWKMSLRDSFDRTSLKVTKVTKLSEEKAVKQASEIISEVKILNL